MREEINEQISVLASFDKNQIKIMAFKWGQTKYIVIKTNLAYEAREGQELVRYFSVSDPGNLFTLAFYPLQNLWQLKEVFSQ